MYKRDYTIDQFKVEDKIKYGLQDYDNKAKVWHEIFVRSLPPITALPKSTDNNSSPVLDIGCNTGYFTAFLQQQYGYAEGIDINPVLINASTANSKNCKVMDVCDLKYSNNTFSLVVAKDVLEHSYAPTKAIEEIYRVLMDGGMLLAMLPLDGDVVGTDEVVMNNMFNFGNESHAWKATLEGVLHRLFDVGFTDIDHIVYPHSALFGEKRELGDGVLVVKAVKKSNVIRLPFRWLHPRTYWAAFITFICGGNCNYCIQTLSKDEFYEARKVYEAEAISAKEWMDFFLNVQRYNGHRLSIIGGEPTEHKEFFDIVNGLSSDYSITVTTNLQTSMFNNISNFISNLAHPHSLRINTSFHPHISGTDEFCVKINELREAGINVDQVAMVDYPGDDFKRYYKDFISRGVVLTPQTFLGKIGDGLFPNDSYTDYKEHKITDTVKYEEGFSYRNKKPMVCLTDKLLFAPNGNAYVCHYHLYSNRRSMFNIKDIPNDLLESDDYIVCNDYGFCNPCDFPSTRFRSTKVTIANSLIDMLRDDIKDKMSQSVISFINEEVVKKSEVAKVGEELTNRLYLSRDPLWSLYNDNYIRTVINDCIRQNSLLDNTNAMLFARFNALILNAFKRPVNIYRILDPDVLCKYIDALAYITNKSIEKIANGKVVIEGLPGVTGNILCTLALSHLDSMTVGGIDE